jgi:hypothetical protein
MLSVRPAPEAWVDYRDGSPSRPGQASTAAGAIVTARSPKGRAGGLDNPQGAQRRHEPCYQPADRAHPGLDALLGVLDCHLANAEHHATYFCDLRWTVS